MHVNELLDAVAAALLERGGMLVTAESCTGGWVAKLCTDRAGSSRWFERGYVTYSNAAKAECLGVPVRLLDEHGAVSEPVARAMAEGARRVAGAHAALSVTGVAGPDGGTEEKPIGLVWFAWAVDGIDTVSEVRRFTGDRESVRRQSVTASLHGLLRVLATA